MRFCFYILLVGVLAIGAGCVPWKPAEKTGRISFPKTRLAIDAVGLEVAVAQLDQSQSDLMEQYWRLLDEQEFPLALRKRLDQNGIRVAVMSSSPPASFHQLLAPPTIVPEQLSEFEKQLYQQGLYQPPQRKIVHERISNREGQSHPVTISQQRPEASWVVQNGDKRTIGVGKQVSGVMQITTFPQGDGTVRLLLRPEFHHGDQQRRLGFADQAIFLEDAQTVTPLDDLKIDVTLRPGQSIVIAPTPDQVGVGQVLFDTPEPDPDSHKPAPKNRMLLVRVVQTQMDDLFSDANLGEKLSTVSGL